MTAFYVHQSRNYYETQEGGGLKRAVERGSPSKSPNFNARYGMHSLGHSSIRRMGSAGWLEPQPPQTYWIVYIGVLE